METVFSLMHNALARRGLGENAWASLALHRINQWLSERFPQGNNAVRAERIVDHVLYIACSHSALLQELQQQLPDLRSFLTDNCPFMAITDIRMVRSTPQGGNVLAPANPPA